MYYVIAHMINSSTWFVQYATKSWLGTWLY